LTWAIRQEGIEKLSNRLHQITIWLFTFYYISYATQFLLRGTLCSRGAGHRSVAETLDDPLGQIPLIGPTIAGLLVASVGEGVCFILNRASYLAVLVALAAMRLAPKSHHRKQRQNVVHELREGFNYAFGAGPIRSILLLLALVSLTGMPYVVLAPVFAKEVLHGASEFIHYKKA